MSEPLILVSRTASVTTSTLNRPMAMNSFNAALHAELRAAPDAAFAPGRIWSTRLPRRAATWDG